MTQIQVVLVYRSPNISLEALTVILSQLLVYISITNLPTFILGDFNNDIISQPNSSIVSLMSSYSFTQLVTSPTTAQNTLIDHVYYNKPSSNIIVEVQDTYYSDHDTIYCSIPI